MAISSKLKPGYSRYMATDSFSLAALLDTDAVKVLCESMVIDHRNDFINYYTTLYPTHMDRVVIAQTLSGSHNVINLHTGTIINTFERRMALSSFSHDSQLWCAIDPLTQTLYLRDWAIPRLLIFHEFQDHIVLSTALMKDYIAIIYTTLPKMRSVKSTGKISSKSCLSRVTSENELQDPNQKLEGASTLINVESIGLITPGMDFPQQDDVDLKYMNRSLSQIDVISNTARDLADIEQNENSSDSNSSEDIDKRQISHPLKNYTSMSLARDQNYMIACAEGTQDRTLEHEMVAQTSAQEGKQLTEDPATNQRALQQVPTMPTSVPLLITQNPLFSQGAVLSFPEKDDARTPIDLTASDREPEFTVAIYRINKSAQGNTFTAPYSLEKVVCQRLQGSAVLGSYFEADQTKLHIIMDKYEMYTMDLITYHTELIKGTAYPQRFGMGHSGGRFLFNLSSTGHARTLMLNTPVSFSSHYMLTSNKECSTLYRNGKVYIEGFPPAACLSTKKPVVWFYIAGRFCELNLLKVKNVCETNLAPKSFSAIIN